MRLAAGLRLGDLRKTAAAPSSLLTGLVSYWKLNEESGERADSVVASGNNLSDNNTATYDTGVIGNAAKFTAGNHEWLNKASLANPASFSLSMWFKVPASPSPPEGIFTIGNGNYNTGSKLCVYLGAGGRINIEAWSDGSDSVADNPLIAAGWHFIVGTYDGATNKAGYSIDGAALTEGSAETSPITVDRLLIGTINTGGFWYNDLIDEAGLWSRVLEADEITALYNSGAGVTYPFLGT